MNATSTDADAAFWSSRPRLRDDVARVLLDDHLVLWPAEASPGYVDRVGSIVARFMTGDATIAELAEDFAVATDVPEDQARTLVGSLAAGLARGGLAEPLPDAPSFDAGAVEVELGEELPEAEDTLTPENAGGAGANGSTADFAEELAAALGTDEGTRYVVEDLPDGRKRVSTQFTLDSSDQTDRARLVAEVLAGERSIAELAPPDSCLGFRLRIGVEVDQIDVVVDGAPYTVRCDHAPTAAALRSRFAPALADQHGPTAAFVVAPFEGTGPCRVFDPAGRRRGRPRTAEETAALVAQLIAEQHHIRNQSRGLLAWGALVRDEAAVLIDPELLGLSRVGAASRRNGLDLADFRMEVDRDGHLAPPPINRHTSPVQRVDVVGIVLSALPHDAHPGPALIKKLMTGWHEVDLQTRQQYLDAIMAMVAHAQLIVHEPRDGRSVVDVATRIFDALPRRRP